MTMILALLCMRTAAATHGHLNVAPCRPALEHQSWNLSGGTLQLAGGTGGCAEYGGDGVALVLRTCNASEPAQRWAWIAAHGAIELEHVPGGSTPACADLRYGAGSGFEPGDVGGYFQCHYRAGLPSSNEGWALGQGGRITSTYTGMAGQWHGGCLTAAAPGPSPPPPAPPAPPPTPPPPDLRSGLNIWPIPRGEEHASGPPLPLAAAFAVIYTGGSAVAMAAAARYTALIHTRQARHTDTPQTTPGADGMLHLLRVWPICAPCNVHGTRLPLSGQKAPCVW